MPPADMKNCVYLVVCSDGSLYCGWTNNLEQRVSAHNQGKGAKYTKPRRPVSLIWWAICQSRSDAMKAEAAIKKLSRSEKQSLSRREAGLCWNPEILSDL